jgi:tetratricopeptide (TPR) repeat protein
MLLMAAGWLAYSNSFRGVFVFDDRAEIRDNPALRDLSHPAQAMFGGPGLPRRPLPYLSFAVNYAIAGTDVEGFHAVNVAIHVAASVILFDVVRRSLASPRLLDRYASSAAPLALAASLLWVVHPLTTQAVTYIYQRMESMMALMYLLTIACFVHASHAARPTGWLAASIVCCGLGMGCKEVMITAPLLVLWYDRVFVARDWREIVQRRWAYYVGLAATWIVLFAVIRCQANRYVELDSPRHSSLSYALNQSAVILHYLRLVFLPTDLCLDYGWQGRTIRELIVPVACVVLALGATACCMVWRPTLGFLCGSFFLILAPSSSFLPVDELAFEHRMYLPLAVVSIACVLAASEIITWLAKRLEVRNPRGGRIGVALTTLTAITLAAVTRARNSDYDSFVGMWADVVAKSPTNAKAYKHLGLGLADAGRMEESVEAFRRAIALGETPPQAAAGWLAGVYSNVGTSLVGLGRVDDAAAAYAEAVRLNPDDCLAQMNRGVVAARRGEVGLAEQCFEKVIALDRNNAAAHVNLGLVLAGDDPAEAMRLYERAVSLNPAYAPAFAAIGRLHLRLGRRSLAVKYLEQAVRLDPRFVAAQRDLEEAMALPR